MILSKGISAFNMGRKLVINLSRHHVQKLAESSPPGIVKVQAGEMLPRVEYPVQFLQANNFESQILKPLEQIAPMSSDIPGMIHSLESRVVGKPSIAKIMTSLFGCPCVLHSFTSGKVFDHVLRFIFKTSLLVGEALADLLSVQPLH